jgi:hypothetical protein
MAAVCFALFKIPVDAPHLICHMCKAQDGLLPDLCERIERGCFHFDCHQIPFDHGVDRRLGLAERRFGCPGRACEHRHGKSTECAVERRDQSGIRIRIVGRRHVVIAGAFVAQRAFDDDEIRRRAHRHDLPGGRDADQELAARCEQFLGDQHRVRGADGAADNSELNPVATEAVELRVIAGPSCFKPGLATGEQAAHDVAVRIEDADVRDAGVRNPLLPARFAQQIFRREGGRLRIVLLREDGRDPALIDCHHQTSLVTRLPVIGSVLSDNGQALRNSGQAPPRFRRRQKRFQVV